MTQNYSQSSNSDYTAVWSVVSHGQELMVSDLLRDVKQEVPEARIILTQNIPAACTANHDVICVRNTKPKGFGENHNSAFRLSQAPFFNVVNPDIRLSSNPLPSLLKCFDDPRVGVVAPRVVNASGMIEDSARHFPTIRGLMRKATLGHDGGYANDGEEPMLVDWVAGMFMLFRAKAFAEIGGFDEKFFLYYEDADICARLWSAGWKVMLHPGVSVVHTAQRTSHRNARYACWHLKSIGRYLLKHRGGASRRKSGC